MITSVFANMGILLISSSMLHCLDFFCLCGSLRVLFTIKLKINRPIYHYMWHFLGLQTTALLMILVRHCQTSLWFSIVSVYPKACLEIPELVKPLRLGSRCIRWHPNYNFSKLQMNCRCSVNIFFPKRIKSFFLCRWSKLKATWRHCRGGGHNGCTGGGWPRRCSSRSLGKRWWGLCNVEHRYAHKDLLVDHEPPYSTWWPVLSLTEPLPIL